MAYTPLDATKPDASTQAGTAFGTSTRANLMALRDMITVGAALDWSMTPSGGSASEPAVLTYANGTERVKVTLTWTSGKVTKAKYEYSSNSGGLYEDMGTNCFQNITYDGSDNVTGITWGTS